MNARAKKELDKKDKKEGVDQKKAMTGQTMMGKIATEPKKKPVNDDATKIQIFKSQLEFMIKDFFGDEEKDSEIDNSVRISLITEIERVWPMYPYMRLGQLLVTISDQRDIFYTRDEDLLKRFEDLGEPKTGNGFRAPDTPPNLVDI